MAYSERAIEQRICQGTGKNGEPCRAWALWDDPFQFCVRHSGRWQPTYGTSWSRRPKRTRYKPCTCIAYAWPHRPAGGYCCWPDEPDFRLTTPASTHRWPRLRRPGSRLLLAKQRLGRR